MANPRTLPELLLPAGGFDSAIAAIEGGADALYLGFADFSARKQAKNFDRTEYRKLYRLARDRGVRLYAALNTIILQDELEAAAALLAFLGRFPPDAVIVQDWGLARLVRDRHPGIAIHASTQAAVQGSEGARIARELGASRIVLPRETSIAEMARLRDEEPGLEYEAFVHGALCYSFSGLCLASGLVLGRSGNRGECAQLCRSYYSAEGGAMSGRTGYWFSCRDLDLGERLGELAAAGISSFKIEGRMKSPEYCFAVASLYRGLLDGLDGRGPGEEELAARREASRIAFARSPTEAWISERGGADLIDSAYPGHLGVSAGRIVSNQGGRLVVDLDGPLGLRDGLLGFEGGDPSRPLRFPVLELRDARTGRELFRAKAGSRVELLAEAEKRVGVEPRVEAQLRAGDQLRRISSRDLDRRIPSREEYEGAREELPLKLYFSASGLVADLTLPGFGGRAGAMGGAARIESGGPIPLDKAKNPGGLARALEVFGESGEADFRLVAETDEQALADLFIPPSALKREKNRIYSRAADILAGAELAYALDSLSPTRSIGAPKSPVAEAPPRAALVFPREGLPSGLPFAGPRDLARGSALPSWGGRSWLPLAPLVLGREAYAELAKRRAEEALEAGESLAVGLGALHHFAIARELRSISPAALDSRLSFFLDINLYVANDFAYASLSALLPGIEFAYRYLELEASGEGDAPLAPVGLGFEPPLFQSLGCFLKHNVLKGACPEACSRKHSSLLFDRGRRYRVLVEDCVTTLFRIQGSAKP